MEIGTVIRKLRKARRWSQLELTSRMTKYDPGNLSRFERGEQGIDPEHLEEIAGIFGLPVSEFYRMAESGGTLPAAPQPPKPLEPTAEELAAMIKRMPTPMRQTVQQIVVNLANTSSQTFFTP